MRAALVASAATVTAALIVLAGTPTVRVLYLRDGGVAKRLIVLDGGVALEELPDGSVRLLPSAAPSTCVTDAGTSALTLLAKRACRSDGDCVTISPHVNASGFLCCYALERAVADTAEFRELMNSALRECGHVNLHCEPPCERAACRAGTCRIVGEE